VSAARRAEPNIRTYVLDTSVLLSDPKAMYRFAEHEVVIPLIVVAELEAKRTHPELGFFARAALRQLDEMRVEHGRLDQPMKVNDDGGELSVDMSHAILHFYQLHFYHLIMMEKSLLAQNFYQLKAQMFML